MAYDSQLKYDLKFLPIERRQSVVVRKYQTVYGVYDDIETTKSCLIKSYKENNLVNSNPQARFKLSNSPRCRIAEFQSISSNLPSPKRLLMGSFPMALNQSLKRPTEVGFAFGVIELGNLYRGSGSCVVLQLGSKT